VEADDDDDQMLMMRREGEGEEARETQCFVRECRIRNWKVAWRWIRRDSPSSWKEKVLTLYFEAVASFLRNERIYVFI
jgi:hypothetical protein